MRSSAARRGARAHLVRPAERQEVGRRLRVSRRLQVAKHAVQVGDLAPAHVEDELGQHVEADRIQPGRPGDVCNVSETAVWASWRNHASACAAVQVSPDLQRPALP